MNRDTFYVLCRIVFAFLIVVAILLVIHILKSPQIEELVAGSLADVNISSILGINLISPGNIWSVTNLPWYQLLYLWLISVPLLLPVTKLFWDGIFHLSKRVTPVIGKLTNFNIEADLCLSVIRGVNYFFLVYWPAVLYMIKGLWLKSIIWFFSLLIPGFILLCTLYSVFDLEPLEHGPG